MYRAGGGTRAKAGGAGRWSMEKRDSLAGEGYFLSTTNNTRNVKCVIVHAQRVSVSACVSGWMLGCARRLMRSGMEALGFRLAGLIALGLRGFRQEFIHRHHINQPAVTFLFCNVLCFAREQSKPVERVETEL